MNFKNWFTLQFYQLEELKMSEIKQTDIEKIFFAMVTFNEIFIGKTDEELFNALYYRQFPYCEIAMLYSYEEAYEYANRRYYQIFLANPVLYGLNPMPLPTSENERCYNIRNFNFENLLIEQYNKMEISAKSANQNLPMPYTLPVVKKNVNDNLFWAIDANNGFAVASNPNELLNLMLHAGFIYPHAIPFANEMTAGINARNNYLDRFFCRYSMNETVYLPDNIICSGEYFIDDLYSEREKRRADNLAVNQLKSNGLL